MLETHLSLRSVTLLLLLVLAVPWLSHCSPDNHLHGIAFISVTTDDIESSLRFYAELLGGMHVKEMAHSFHGDDHYHLLFFKELQDAKQRGEEPVGVPDISDSGNYEVRVEFVVFDNGLVQLMQFVQRKGPGQGSSFKAVEPNTSPAYITAPHLCLWVQDDVDFNNYIAQVEARAGELNLPQVKFNRPVEVHSDAERLAVPEDHLGITFLQGDFSGLSFAYFKGPTGEQLELYRITQQFRHNVGRQYCRRRAVATAFARGYSDNAFKRAAGVPAKLFGLFQFGTRTHDLWRSVDFYVNVLGAEDLRQPLQGVNIRGDDIEFMLFQKELLDAQAWRVAPRDIGVANVSASGDMRLDLRFSLFDNYVVETLVYTDGLRLGDDPGFNPRYNHSSLAYPHDMYVAFHLSSDIDLGAYVQEVERLADVNGFPHVKAARTSLDQQNHFAFSSGPMAGFGYSMFNGPAGEHVAVVQFKGQAGEKLKRALIQYGAVSTAFPETNPWNSGVMQEFCRLYESDPVGR